jgi:hypothetical protein
VHFLLFFSAATFYLSTHTHTIHSREERNNENFQKLIKTAREGEKKAQPTKKYSHHWVKEEELVWCFLTA